MPLMTVNSSYERLYGMSEKEYFTGQYLTTELLEDGVVEFKMNKTLTTAMYQYIQYSIDGVIWETANNVDNQEVILSTRKLHKGYKVQWRGVGGQLCPDNSNYYVFGGTAKFNVYGNIMSLLHGKDFIEKQQIITNPTQRILSCAFRGSKVVSAEDLILPIMDLSSTTNRIYYNMFHYCSSLTTAPELPATTLGNGCYWGMFESCSSLLKTPKLPAKTLANHSYRRMFYYCTSLIKANEMEATTNSTYACREMFYHCTSLIEMPKINFTTAPTESCWSMFQGCSKLTILKPFSISSTNGCQQMFQGCTSLVDASGLTITAVGSTQACYNMFYGCTSLTKAPVLAATTLANNCYQGMFNGCKSLTTAPELPATILVSDCYKQMFYNCNNLNYIKLLATNISASNCLSNWVYRVAATGTFVKEWNTNPPRSNNGIPSGWTIQNLNVPDPETPYETVVFIPPSGEVQSGTQISLDLSDGFVADGIFYTLDGTNPTSSSLDYDRPIVLTEDTTIKAAAYNVIDTKYALGEIGTATYTVVAAPEPIYRLWFDDFPFPSDEEFDGYYKGELQQAEIEDPDGMGANLCLYYGDTFEYDGDEYYIWEWYCDGQMMGYILTDTDNFNTLYSQSLENETQIGQAGSDIPFTSLVAMLYPDKYLQYEQDDLSDQQLVKIELYED